MELEVFMHPEEKALLEEEVKKVPPDGSIVEWGAGGSTVFISSTKDPSVAFDSVEHVEEWQLKVQKEITDNRTSCLLVKPTGDFSAFATIQEEDDRQLQDYVNTPIDISIVDLFLVDGVARNACLRRIFKEGKVGCRVLLHDAERSWYDDVRALFTEETRQGRLVVLTKK